MYHERLLIFWIGWVAAEESAGNWNGDSSTVYGVPSIGSGGVITGHPDLRQIHSDGEGWDGDVNLGTQLGTEQQ